LIKVYIFFEKYALIITDYFSDNDIKTFYPKKISEYGIGGDGLIFAL
jgi:hypothetical protein